MDDDYIPIETLLTLQRDPTLFAYADGYVQRRIKQAEKLAEFIKGNPRLFRSQPDKWN